MRFTLCGLLNCSISYTLFVALYRLVGIHYVPASSIGYCAGIVNSFLMNRAYTFKARGAVQPMIGKFVLVTGVGFGLNLTSLYLLVAFLRLAPEFAQGLALVCAGCLNFVGNKVWTFKPVPIES